MAHNLSSVIDLMAGFFWSGKLFNVVRRREFSALAVASLLAVPECLHAASAMQKVSIALAARPSLYHLPLLLADQLGYFKSEGLLIDWQDQESGLQAVQTLLQGQADVMAGAFEHTIDLQARGLNYRTALAAPSWAEPRKRSIFRARKRPCCGRCFALGRCGCFVPR